MQAIRLFGINYYYNELQTTVPSDIAKSVHPFRVIATNIQTFAFTSQ